MVKFEEGKNRTIKIMFEDSFIAFNFLKHKFKLNSEVKIVRDMTNMEKNELKKLKMDLEELNRESISKTNKFVSGHLKIVDVESRRTNLNFRVIDR